MRPPGEPRPGPRGRAAVEPRRNEAENRRARFRPPATSRTRWERLWAAGREGAPLPPISVYRLGDRHFVNDGHHRVSVARSLGMNAIDAEVTELRLPKANSARLPDVAAVSYS